MQEGIGLEIDCNRTILSVCKFATEKGMWHLRSTIRRKQKKVKGADAAHAGKRQSAGEAYRATNTQTAGNEEYACTQSGWYVRSRTKRHTRNTSWPKAGHRTRLQ